MPEQGAMKTVAEKYAPSVLLAAALSLIGVAPAAEAAGRCLARHGHRQALSGLTANPQHCRPVLVRMFQHRDRTVGKLLSSLAGVNGCAAVLVANPVIEPPVRIVRPFGSVLQVPVGDWAGKTCEFAFYIH